MTLGVHTSAGHRHIGKRSSVKGPSRLLLREREVTSNAVPVPVPGLAGRLKLECHSIWDFLIFNQLVLFCFLSHFR